MSSGDTLFQKEKVGEEEGFQCATKKFYAGSFQYGITLTFSELRITKWFGLEGDL